MDSHSVRTKKDVEDFLRHFLPTMDVLGIIFLNRSKNQEALKMLGITPSARKEVIFVDNSALTPLFSRLLGRSSCILMSVFKTDTAPMR